MQAQGFDAIICDGILDDGLGLDFIDELRSVQNETPILFVSAALTPQLPWKSHFAFLAACRTFRATDFEIAG